MPQTARWANSHDYPLAPEIEQATVPPRHRRFRFVIVQETPGVWLVRGLEHDIVVESRSIGTAVRAAVAFVEAHTAFDMRHDLRPLSAFPPAPPSYWHAYSVGTPASLMQLGIEPLSGWQLCAAVTHRHPQRTSAPDRAADAKPTLLE